MNSTYSTSTCTCISNNILNIFFYVEGIVTFGDLNDKIMFAKFRAIALHIIMLK